MTLLRLSLYTLAALSTLILGVGIYAYTQLPTLADEQARKYLGDYGVQTLKYQGVALTSKQLQFDELFVEGSIDEIDYRAEVSSLNINFKWQELLAGKLESVIAANLKLSIDDRSTQAPESDPPTSLTLSSFLPRQYLVAIPLERLEVQHWQLNYNKATDIALQADGALVYDGQLALSFQTGLADTSLEGEFWTQGIEKYPGLSVIIKQNDLVAAKVSTILSLENHNKWLWSSTGEVDYSTLTNALRSAKQNLNLEWDLSNLDLLQLQGNSRLDVKVHHDDTIELLPKTQQNLLPQFQIEAVTDHQITNLFVEKHIQTLSGELAISATLRDGQFALTLSPTTIAAELLANPATLPKDIQTWLKWEDTIPVHWHNPSDITLSSQANGSWVAQLQKSAVRIGDKHSQVQFQDLNLKGSFFATEDPHGNLELETRIAAHLRRHQLPTLKVSAKLEGKQTDAKFELTLNDIAQSLEATATGQANLSTGASNIALRAVSDDLRYASETMLPLLHSLNLLSKQVNPKISSGRLNFSSSLRSTSFELKNINLKNELTVESLSGDFNSYSFAEAALKAKWSGIDQLKTLEPVELSVAKLNLGIELSDTQIKLSLPKATPVSQPAILINHFSTRMFGGEVFLPEPKQWDFGAKTNSFRVSAKGWQLADMVALQQDEDIHAQGTLEGQLPIELTAGRLIIAGGYLRAIAPGGTIRYVANEASEALAASSPELELALDLLSDFQFQVLSSEVDLDSAGNLLLGLSLQGKNPTQFDGRPINFNINLEQNLDPLLQSLRLSDKLVEKLEDRLK